MHVGFRATRLQTGEPPVVACVVVLQATTRLPVLFLPARNPAPRTAAACVSAAAVEPDLEDGNVDIAAVASANVEEVPEKREAPVGSRSQERGAGVFTFSNSISLSELSLNPKLLLFLVL